MDNLEEMDRFLGKFNLPMLNLEEIEIMNKPITNTEIETEIKKSPKKQNPRAKWLPGEFYQSFRKELMTIFMKPFQKITEEGTLPDSFYEATITLIPKPGKDNTQKRKLHTNITDKKFSTKF